MIWMQTATGRAFDLLNPRARQVDFVGDVAPALARSGRYGGHVPGGVYSVAQHCVLGADALLQETGQLELAAGFLLHDAHEAYLGDITRPAGQALEILVDEAAEEAGWSPMPGAGRRGPFKQALGKLKLRLDQAIYAAAALPIPIGQSASAIHAMDVRMLKAERDHLLIPPPTPWSDDVENARPVNLRGKIKIWPWPAAADEWLQRLKAWCPQANGF